MGAGTASGATDLAGMRDVLTESRPKLLRVLLVQVDLVFSPVQGEPHGALSLPAVNVVYEECCDLLGHLESAFPGFDSHHLDGCGALGARTHPVPHKPG